LGIILIGEATILLNKLKLVGKHPIATIDISPSEGFWCLPE